MIRDLVSEVTWIKTWKGFALGQKEKVDIAQEGA